METSEEAGSQVGKGAWTEEEHNRFVEALRLYGKDWPAIAAYVQTRSSIQVKSHAQKFLKTLSKSEDPNDKLLFESLQVNLRNLNPGDKEFYRDEHRAMVNDALYQIEEHGINNQEFRQKYTLLPH